MTRKEFALALLAPLLALFGYQNKPKKFKINVITPDIVRGLTSYRFYFGKSLTSGAFVRDKTYILKTLDGI